MIVALKCFLHVEHFRKDPSCRSASLCVEGQKMHFLL